MARSARAKSPVFQRSISDLRNGRSYQEFTNAIKAKTGISFSRSYLKRVEDGELAPNPMLLFALELLAGRRPSELLLEYARDAGGSDLLRHAAVGQGGSTSKGGADVPAEARVRELESRVVTLTDENAAYAAIIKSAHKLAAELGSVTALREEGGATRRSSTSRGRGHRKTG